MPAQARVKKEVKKTVPPTRPQPNKKFQLSVLLICFFVSGICGLVYEVAWLRVMSVLFGNTTFATSTILSSYMAGLGFGALYWGRRIDRSSKNPIRFYGLLEMGVGIYAFLTPFIWKAMEFALMSFYRQFEPSFLVFNLFKFVLAFVALFVPTFLMGGTLPVVSKFFVQQREDTARYVGLLYALNTFGAVLGVLFTGFYALYGIGVWETVILTGIFNFAIFGLCRRAPEQTVNQVATTTTAPMEQDPSRIRKRLLLVLFGISGAVSMMYEVGWTRGLTLGLGSSVYAFSVMLATFLFGIAIGSYLLSLAAKRLRIDFFTFSVLQILTAIFVFIGIRYFESIPYYFSQVFKLSGGSQLKMELGKFFLCSGIMLLPTILIGAIFTCFIQLYRRTESLGRELGFAYFANTIGTIFGSALTGFFILPAIGIQNTLIAGGWINAMIGIAVFFLVPMQLNRKRLIASGVLCFALLLTGLGVKPWNKAVMSSDTAVKPEKVAGISKDAFFKSFGEREILFYKEGLSATISVARVRDNISLAVNGKVDASNSDTFTQYLLGHLPMLLHNDPKKVLVIGLGSASTTAAVATYPVETIYGVELEKEVAEAAPFFKQLNRDVLKDPRVHLFINDGRNFLLVRPDRYDVIISEPSNPWMAGVANLFSLEHFKTMNQRLTPGGIVCQWLHAYSMSTEDLAMIIKTFSLGFPHVQLWSSYYPDLILIGSNQPIDLDITKLREGLNQPQTIKDLGPHGVTSAEALLGSFWLGSEQLREISKSASVHTDNKPLLEFSAPRHLYQNTLALNYLFLNETWKPEGVPVKEKNARLYNEIAKAFIAKKLSINAEGALERSNEIEPGNVGYLEAHGMLLFQQGRFDQAVESLTKAVQLRPEVANAHYYLSLAFLQKKDWARAKESIAAAIKLKPRKVTYRKTQAEIFFASGDAAAALPIYEKLLRLKGGADFDLWARIGEVHLSISLPEKQIEFFKELSRRYQRFAPARLKLGQLYETQRNLPEAAYQYEQYCELMPDALEGYLSRARVYDAMGRLPEMAAMIKKAVKIQPGLAANPQIQKILSTY